VTEPRKLTEKFMDEHDFLMLVPEFLVRGTGKDPDTLIMELANKDLHSFEIFANADDIKWGLKRGDIKYYKPYILPIQENPLRYEALKRYVEETVTQASASKKMDFNADNFSFQFDEPTISDVQMVGIPNIKYFRIVRLLKEGEPMKQEVPDPSFFCK